MRRASQVLPLHVAARELVLGYAAPALVALVAIVTLARPATAALEPKEAMAHLGESVTIEGRVDGVVCSPMACLISFETNYSGLIASIPGPSIAKFPPVKETYWHKLVRVRGTVSQKNGRARIDLTDPSAIEVIGAGAAAAPSRDAAASSRSSSDGASRPRPNDGGAGRVSPDGSAEHKAATAPSSDRSATSASASRPAGDSGAAGQAEVAGGEAVTLRPRPEGSADQASTAPSSTSNDDLLQEIRALRDQVAGLSDQMSGLDSRISDLEAAQQAQQAAASAPIVPPPPSFVVSEQRPLSLRRVAKGWTADRVLRAMGEPAGVTGGSTGVTTWYYGDGRAVSLDANGRVVSTAGF